MLLRFKQKGYNDVSLQPTRSIALVDTEQIDHQKAIGHVLGIKRQPIGNAGEELLVESQFRTSLEIGRLRDNLNAHVVAAYELATGGIRDYLKRILGDSPDSPSGGNEDACVDVGLLHGTSEA